MELQEMQKKVYENKVNHGFNVTDVPQEFCKAFLRLFCCCFCHSVRHYVDPRRTRLLGAAR